MTDIEEILKEIYFKTEVRQFLERFVCPVGYEGQFPELPSDIQQVVHDLSSLWEEEGGFIDPAKITDKLLKKYLPDLPEKVRTYIHDYLWQQYTDKDHLSGGMRKNCLGDFMGLGHLMSKVNNGHSQDIAMFWLDFSNMGGTNLHFKKLLAVARGVEEENIRDEEANDYTDRVARIISESITSILMDRSKQASYAVRAGGDEIGFLVSGLQPSDYEEVKQEINSTIEHIISLFGLTDHDHMKAGKKGNPNHFGFGAIGAFINMKTMTNPAESIRDADRKIAQTTQEVGAQRRKQRESDVPTQVTDKGAAQAVLWDIEQRLLLFELYRGKGLTDTQRPKMIRLDSLLHDIPPFTSLYQRRLLGFRALCNGTVHLEREADENIELDYNLQAAIAGNRALIDYLEQVTVMDPQDPATKTKTEKDLAATLGIFMEDCVDEASDDPANLYVTAVNFHNIAGFNNAFGHMGADIYLEHVAQDIIVKSVAEAGLSYEAGECEIFHRGGGTFIVICKPQSSINEDVVKEIEAGIHQKIHALSAYSAERFFAEKEIPMQPNTDIDTFADIADAKNRPGCNGLHVTTYIIEAFAFAGIKNIQRPGQLVFVLNECLEQKIHEYRVSLGQSVSAPLVRQANHFAMT